MLLGLTGTATPLWLSSRASLKVSRYTQLTAANSVCSQTIESLHMLRSKKTPFVVALNKVDRLYGWEHVKDRPFVEAIALQPDFVQREFEDRAAAALLALAEQVRVHPSALA